MILITGGTGQGMQPFAMQQFGRRIKDDAVDGSAASWEEFKKAKYSVHLEEMIRRRLAQEEQKEPEERKELEKLENEMAAELFHACPERIVITEEIGCGIVPMDAFERKYRELTGRICCQLAAVSQEVWRVTAGIGQRIK